MAKTKDGLNQLKQGYEPATAEFKELTNDELKKVVGGNAAEDLLTTKAIKEKLCYVMLDCEEDDQRGEFGK